MEKWLLWPDTHFPKHDERKVKVMMKLLKRWKPDHLTFMGDIDHMDAPSRWVEGSTGEYTQRLEVTTEILTKQFLIDVRDALPKTEILYLEGNHEKRLEEYIDKNAPALVGTVTMEKLLDLENLGIEYHKYKLPPKRMFGNYYVHHGSFVSKHPGQSAQKELDHYGVSGFTAHTHRLGSYHASYLDGRELSWYECGHLSDCAAQDYAQHHNWQHGFIYCYVDGDDVFPFEAKFVGDRVVVDGKTFS